MANGIGLTGFPPRLIDPDELVPCFDDRCVVLLEPGDRVWHRLPDEVEQEMLGVPPHKHIVTVETAEGDAEQFLSDRVAFITCS